AKRMEKMGADAVVAEGTEAGGHVGETTTMALLPQIADAVNIPVIGA
ncbi:nitronate monooxygenase, partial [Listeria seeligeri]